MDNLKTNKNFFHRFFDRLSSRPYVGGLYITSGGIEYVFFEKQQEAFSVKFPDGVIVDGKIQKPLEFLEIAKKFFELISKKLKNKANRVVVSLPVSAIYTQLFSVPNINREKLEESSMLNLQMLSPIPKENAYMSAQVIGESPERYDLFGAFIERKIVDDFRELLQQANFLPIAFEFPALSFTRLLNFFSPANNSNTPSLLIHISNDGVNFFVVKNGMLYFDYFRSWQNIQGNETNIQKETFMLVIITEARKVSNFVLSHFKEPIAMIHIITSAFQEELVESLKKELSLNVRPLIFPKISLSPAWYPAIGASLRDFSQNDINLNAESVNDLFFQEHAISFIYFWRRIFVLISVLFVFVFFLVSSFFENQFIQLQNQLRNAQGQGNAKELNILKNKATDFNSIVADLKRQPRKIVEWSAFFLELNQIALNTGVTIDRISMPSFSSPVVVYARGVNSNAALLFKNTLVKRNGFSQVDLPLLSIKELENRTVGFSISFLVDQKVFQEK